jgi:transglutaminase/protease-like cytokinesis protein 3
MKKIVFLFVLIATTVFSQEEPFQQIDDRVKSYQPFETIEALAQQIASDFPSDRDRIRAVYSWVATHIAYSYQNPFQTGNVQFFIVTDEDDYQRRLKRQDQKIASQTFKDQKGTCKGFSLLFQKICTVLDIESHVILGYVKESPNAIGFVPEKKNHAWNAAKVNNQWIFLDVTAASGYKLNGVWQPRYTDAYFDLKKETLANTYFAKEVTWRERIYPMSLKEFSRLPKFSTAFFHQNFEVVQPQFGFIKSQKKSMIQLEIKGIDPKTQVYYQYGQGSVRRASVSRQNSISKISVRSPKKDAILKLFFNNQEALNYKVTLID